MAELPLERGALREGTGREATAARERFLTRRMWLALGGLALFALTFDRPVVHDDGTYYFAFVRRLFGADVVAQAYQFGSAFWTAPFYLASQLVASRGEYERYHAGELGTAVAANVAGVLVLYLGWRILRELDLPRGVGVLLLTLFGTPLWFYVVIEPGYKHAADTLYLTGAAFLLLRAYDEPRRRYLVGAGALLGLMLATRYANVALLVGLPVMFAGRRPSRSVWWVATAAIATAALLYAIPVARGISFEAPPGGFPVAADMPALVQTEPVRVAAPGGGPLLISVPGSSQAEFDPLAPVKMLFTLHRGLFLWTPLTAFALVGFVLLARRDLRHRAYLLGLLASAGGLLAIHSIWGNFWDGGGSFSQRFLASLFPLYLIGTAELVRRLRGIAYAVLSLCVVWSVWLGLVLTIGYNGFSSDDGLRQLVPHYTGPINRPYDSLGNFAHKFRVRVDERWSLLWREVT